MKLQFPQEMPPVQFADETSAANFHAAIHNTWKSPFRPMLVIEGPPASGKRVLAKWFLKDQLGTDKIVVSFMREGGLIGQLPSIAERGYLFLDDAECLTCRDLATVISADYVASRSDDPRFHRSAQLADPVRTVDVRRLWIVVTGVKIELSEELRRRSLIVRLASEPKEGLRSLRRLPGETRQRSPRAARRLLPFGRLGRAQGR